MAFIPAVAQVTQTFLNENGDTSTNVLHVRKDDLTDFTAAELVAVADDLRSVWLNDLFNHYPDSTTLIRTTARGLDSAPAAPAERGWGDSGNGGALVLPQQLSAVLTLYTALGGASRRGRVYLGPFVQADSTSDGLIDAALVTDIESWWADWTTNLAAAAQSPVVYSRKLNIATAVAAASVRDNRFDTQRRRNNRRF